MNADSETPYEANRRLLRVWHAQERDLDGSRLLQAAIIYALVDVALLASRAALLARLAGAALLPAGALPLPSSAASLALLALPLVVGAFLPPQSFTSARFPQYISADSSSKK